MVKVRPNEYIARLRRPQALAGLQEYEDLGQDLVLLKLDQQQYQKLHAQDEFVYIEPNRCFQRHQDFASPPLPRGPHSAGLDSRLWGLVNRGQDGGTPDADIDADEAWQAGYTGEGVLVAVLDTGTDVSHPDLVGRVWTNPGERADGTDTDGNGVVDDLHGYNATDNTGDPFSDDPHGTHCSGSIAAAGEVVGVAPRAKLLPIRIFDEDDWTDSATIIRALRYAEAAGAQVTSNSYSGLGFSRAVHDAFEQTNMLHVVAAGNHHSNNDEKPHYPPAYGLDNMVVVGASDRHDQFAAFSNFGAESVHLAAPGVDIWSTTPWGNRGSWSGTSMAGPHVAGAAALVAQKHRGETPQQWKSRLLESVDRSPAFAGKVASGGRLNAARAVGLEPKN